MNGNPGLGGSIAALRAFLITVLWSEIVRDEFYGEEEVEEGKGVRAWELKRALSKERVG